MNCMGPLTRLYSSSVDHGSYEPRLRAHGLDLSGCVEFRLEASRRKNVGEALGFKGSELWLTV